MIEILSTALVLAGLLVLGVSLLPGFRLVALLHGDALRNQWRAMIGLIALFVLGYGAYLLLDPVRASGSQGLIVPVIFLLGACFVWMTTQLAWQTATAMHHIALLEAETVTDPLTKTFNRRYLDRRLEEEFARAKRYGTELSVMLIDIDNFKETNDLFGHHAGDRVIVRLADMLTRSVRAVDFVARFGGDEFAVVLPNTQLSDAAKLADRIRLELEAHTFLRYAGSGDHQRPGATASFGVAGLADETSANELLNQADRCLYRAKRLGKDRVITTDTARLAVENSRPAEGSAA